MSHLKIPQIVYDNLRAVNESRARRLDHDAVVPRLTNVQIFAMMPDRKDIQWDEAMQPFITKTTLDAMWQTVEFTKAS